MSDFYSVVGQNNRNALVQSKRIAPYHEDITRVQPFDPAAIAPGQYTKIKIDMKHANDREIILNDIRLKFTVDFSARTGTPVGRVWAVRGTDLIRELTVKINEDIVFKSDKRFDLSMLWLMNNHKTAGNPEHVQNAVMLNHGNIASGHPPEFFQSADSFSWFTGSAAANEVNTTTDRMTIPGEERMDGGPHLIYDDSVTPTYMYTFDISLNQLIGPIFTKLHLRRIEYVQIDLMFEPWLSTSDTQNLLLFSSPPTGVANTLTHPYSVARFSNLEVRQYRTTVLDGINGFTLPDNRMLSWLMHRYSRRDYTFNFDDTTKPYIDIQLHDWEIRTNIVRLWWGFAPLALTPGTNDFEPFMAPCEPYDTLSGVEIKWKNDKVLDLDTTYEVYRHYILSDNKRYGFDDPFITYSRLLPRGGVGKKLAVDKQVEQYTWQTAGNSGADVIIGNKRYEVPLYHVDLNMNIQYGVPGSETINGIVNDTSDYVIRLKRLSDRKNFIHTGTRTLYVWIEYQTLVNLSANSNQFNRASQIITKQLNPQ